MEDFSFIVQIKARYFVFLMVMISAAQSVSGTNVLILWETVTCNDVDENSGQCGVRLASLMGCQQALAREFRYRDEGKPSCRLVTQKRKTIEVIT